jgi:hypothetical protein
MIKVTLMGMEATFVDTLAFPLVPNLSSSE